MKDTGIVIAGFGGQGILFLGRTIAYAAMLRGKEVTWFPSYGAEMRGGTANCTVVVSDELIGSPVVSEIDILIVFNEASFNKFLPRLKKDGLLLYDSSMIGLHESAGANPALAVDVPATEIAAREGIPQGANMVMLGAFTEITKIIELEDVHKTLLETIPPSRQKLVEINKRLIQRGIEYIENKKTTDR